MSEKLESPVRNAIVACLAQQVSELELLQSMYPNSNEVVLTDNNILNDIHNFISNTSEYTPNHLDFVVNILLNGIKLEICINLPSFYPEEEPDVYIRSNQLNRQQQTRLNNELSMYLKSNHLGEVCLHTAISWLQENIDNFKIIIKEDKSNVQLDEEAIENKFVRLWVYSHHIYNKKKREEIVNNAKDLHLTGFCLPGKPGIICVEGSDIDCKQWWKVIKSLTWKKIMIRKTETSDSADQKFSIFQEISFPNSNLRHGKHADMSEFSKFMDAHGLSQVFNELFGLCV